MSLKEYKLPKETFMGGWFIPLEICNGLVSYFNKFNNNATPGVLNGSRIKKDVKDSLDLPIPMHNVDEEILSYRIELQKILELYLKKYPEVNRYNHFNVKTFNIQKYNKKLKYALK